MLKPKTHGQQHLPDTTRHKLSTEEVHREIWSGRSQINSSAIIIYSLENCSSN